MFAVAQPKRDHGQRGYAAPIDSDPDAYAPGGIRIAPPLVGGKAIEVARVRITEARDGGHLWRTAGRARRFGRARSGHERVY